MYTYYIYNTHSMLVKLVFFVSEEADPDFNPFNYCDSCHRWCGDSNNGSVYFDDNTRFIEIL